MLFDTLRQHSYGSVYILFNILHLFCFLFMPYHQYSLISFSHLTPSLSYYFPLEVLSFAVNILKKPPEPSPVYIIFSDAQTKANNYRSRSVMCLTPISRSPPSPRFRPEAPKPIHVIPNRPLPCAGCSDGHYWSCSTACPGLHGPRAPVPLGVVVNGRPRARIDTQIFSMEESRRDERDEMQRDRSSHSERATICGRRVVEPVRDLGIDARQIGFDDESSMGTSSRVISTGPDHVEYLGEPPPYSSHDFDDLANGCAGPSWLENHRDAPPEYSDKDTMRPKKMSFLHRFLGLHGFKSLRPSPWRTSCASRPKHTRRPV